ARPVNAHPLHTTLAEVTVDAPRRHVRATVRLFADDLSAALSRSTAASGALESSAARYVASHFGLSDGSQSIPLHACGVRRAGDVIWVCLESDGSNVNHLRARDSLLTEAFADQVNIVQVGNGSARRSMVFLKGDGDKPILN